MAEIPMRGLLAGACAKRGQIVDWTTRLVLAESPTDDKGAVDGCVELAVELAVGLGGRVKGHRQRRYGDVLEVRFGAKRGKRSAKKTLLLGHLDTVWPLGTLKAMPCRVREGRLEGPGTLDMKAGVAMAFTAVEMLLESGTLENEVILLLNSEEEVGSPVSRPITERLAGECAAVYVLEPALGLAYKTARKGTGDWRITVSGVAAHAGVDFGMGRSAILELMRQMEKVSGWTDLAKGTTVNVGVMGGGTKTNVVPAEAWAEVDLRTTRRAQGPRFEKRFAGLKATAGSGCAVKVEGGINRPPMERTAGTARLFRQARRLAAEIGWELEEASTGGASDGNFTSALGVATLDGMGAVGAGAHAVHEHVLIEHLAPRTALLAAMLAG